MKMPRDIDKLYEPVWEEFVGMKSTKELKALSSNVVIEECFRLLIAAAGTNVKTQMKTEHFVSFEKGIKEVQRWWKKVGLHTTLKSHKAESKVFYQDNKLLHAAISVHLQVEVLFRSKMKNVLYSSKNYDEDEEALKVADSRAWRVRPVKLTAFDYMGRPRKLIPGNRLKDKDYYCVFDTADVVLNMARAKEGIVVRMVVQGPKASPKYKNFESSVRTIKNNQLRGLF